MTTVGITMVKDEADIIETTLRNMLTQVDYVIVADNMSTDGTLDIIKKLQDEFNSSIMRLGLLIDENPAYYQSRKMTAIAHAQMDFADWVVPFDADEIWYSPFGRIGDRLDALGPQWLVVQADLYDQVPTSEDNPNLLNPVERITWRTRDPLPLPKVACRLRKDLVIDHGNHRGLYDESGPTVSHDRFVIRHFPWRSPEQFLRKVTNGHEAYKHAPELGDEFGAHWKSYGTILEAHGPDVTLSAVFYKFFYDQDPARSEQQNRRPLINDPAPVQRG
jgi:glycosyltransferase involved in cell wall biosynthesis